MEACTNPDVLKVILFIKEILKIILFIVPIGLIIMLGIDFFKNVTAGKEDEMKKNLNIAIKRLIYAVILFLVPTVVNFAMSLMGGLGPNFASCYNNAEEEIIEQFATEQAQTAINTLSANPTRENLINAQNAIEKINDKDTKESLNSTIKTIEQIIIEEEKNNNPKDELPREGSKTTSITVTTDEQYLYKLENPNTSYSGHTVNLSDSQYEKVLRSIYGEQEEGSFELYVGLCQYIRDYIDYGSLKRTYDNLGTFWLKRGGNTTAVPAYKNTEWFKENHPEIVKAVDYVFKQGGSLAQRKICFYVDNDDQAYNGGSYEKAYQTLVKASCNKTHKHEKIRLWPESNPDNWSEFNFGID